MGMMLIMAAAAAKKREEEARGRARASARKAEEERRAEAQKREEKARKDRADYKRRHSSEGLNECVLKELINPENPELLNFIEKFYNCGLKIDKQDIQETAKEGEILTDKLVEKALELEKNRKNLEKLGIVLGNKEGTYFHSLMFYDFSAIRKDPEQALKCKYPAQLANSLGKDRVETYELFNGLELTETSLKNPNYKGYDLEYENKKNRYQEKINEEEKLLKRLKRNTTLLKISIFNREKRTDENRNIKKQLKEIASYKAEIEEARIKAETFKKLTPEQKEGILHYIEAREECEKEEYKIKFDTCRTINAITNCWPEKETDRDKWQRTLKLMIQTGEISKEDLEKVIKMFERVEEKQQNNEYDKAFGMWASDEDGKVEKYTNAIKWFVEKVYIPSFEKDKPKVETKESTKRIEDR